MPSGLVFPSNAQSASNATSVRFRFTGAALVPMYGTGGAGVTYLWKYKPIQQAGFYTIMFWANDDGVGTIESTLEWDGLNGGYYGMHPYPHDGSNPLSGSGTQHRWEISIERIDVVDADDPVVKDVWYSQAVRAWGAAGVAKQHEYYWNLPDVTAANRVTRTTQTATWGDNPPPFPALTFGDAPWQPSVERASGILRGWQIYNANLTNAQILALGACETDAEVLAEAAVQGVSGSLWYLNMNPADAGDISDKSGNGNNPAWFNANRPTFWSEDMAAGPWIFPDGARAKLLDGTFIEIRVGSSLGGMG